MSDILCCRNIIVLWNLNLISKDIFDRVRNPHLLDFIANEPPVNYGNLLAALPLPDISPLLFAQNKPKVIVNNDYRSLQRELVENNRLMKAMIKQQHRDAARFKYDQYRAERI